MSFSVSETFLSVSRAITTITKRKTSSIADFKSISYYSMFRLCAIQKKKGAAPPPFRTPRKGTSPLDPIKVLRIFVLSKSTSAIYHKNAGECLSPATKKKVYK